MKGLTHRERCRKVAKACLVEAKEYMTEQNYVRTLHLVLSTLEYLMQSQGIDVPKSQSGGIK